MSAARRSIGRRRVGRAQGPRFRRLVDVWKSERRERTPMEHGQRVYSIEKELGADMTPGRNARWELLDLPDVEVDEVADRGLAHGAERDDPNLTYEDARFRAAVDDVVPPDAPDRDALIERAVDAARERFVDHGEITWPEQALDLAAHADQHRQPDPTPADQHDTQETTVTKNYIRHEGINFPAADSPDWDAWRRDVATALEQGYPEWDAHSYAENQRDAREPDPEPETSASFEPYVTTLPDGSHYLVEEHAVPVEHQRGAPEPEPTAPEHDDVEREPELDELDEPDLEDELEEEPEP